MQYEINVGPMEAMELGNVNDRFFSLRYSLGPEYFSDPRGNFSPVN